MNTDRHAKAVIYCRVASADRTRAALDSQEQRCREYAAQRGYDVAEVFRDEGISGLTLERPGLQALIARIRTRPGSLAVIVDDVARLGRDTSAIISLRAAITEAGGELECAGNGCMNAT